jgi:drug/metabolite transporter (DMT)-like permease
MRAHEERSGLFPLVAAFLCIYVIWGSTYLAIKFAIATIPPFMMAALRFLVAGITVYPWASRTSPQPHRQDWNLAVLTGGLLLLCGNGGVVWSEQHVPSGLAALLVGTVPLWMVLLDWVRQGGSRPAWSTIIGIATGFSGVALLVGPASAVDQGRVPWVPALVLTGASVAWSLGSILNRSRESRVSAWMAGSMQMIGGGGLLLVASVLSGEWNQFHFSQISFQSALGWGYLVVFGSIVSFSAYIWLLRKVSPASVSTYAFVNPAVAVCLGWGLASEPLTPRIMLAMALIVSAVILVTLKRRLPARKSGPAKPKADSGDQP